MDGDGRGQETLQCLPLMFHDVTIGGRDGVEGGMTLEAEDEGIVETAGALQDGATTAAAAKDGNVLGATGGQVYLGGGAVSVTEDDEIAVRLPKTEGFRVRVLVAGVEEGFIAGEVGGGGGEGEVEVFHGDKINFCFGF